MTGKPLLFHQTAEQLRRVSARGGRASARNRRARLRTTAPPLPPPLPPPPPHPETTATSLKVVMRKIPFMPSIGL